MGRGGRPGDLAPGAWVTWEAGAGQRVGQVWSDAPGGAVWVVPVDHEDGEGSVLSLRPDALTSHGNAEPPSPAVASLAAISGRPPARSATAHAQGCAPGVTSVGCAGECVSASAKRAATRESARAAYEAAYLWVVQQGPEVTPALASQWARYVCGGYVAEARALLPQVEVGSRAMAVAA